MIGQYLIIFLISMVPLIELRGAIPVGVGYQLPLLPLYIVAIVGNMIPVPFIYLFGRKVLEFGSKLKYTKRFCNFCMQKGEKAGNKLTKSNGGKYATYIALLFFVGIPLPGTGAWTGSFAASLLKLDFKKSVIAILCGVVLAGIIMGLISMRSVQRFLSIIWEIDFNTCPL